MGHLFGDDIRKNNFTPLFVAELPVWYFPMTQPTHIKIIQIFILPIYSRRQYGNLNIQRIDVLVHICGVHFDYQGRIGRGVFAHRPALQRYPFILNGFHKFHKRIRADYADRFLGVTVRIHAAQSAPQGLLRQDIARRVVGAQADYGGHIAHIPAFLEYQHRDDGLERAVRGINVIGLLAQVFQFLLFLPRAGLRNFTVLFGVNHQHGIF